MQNSMISTWITCLYVSQLSSVVFACKTAHFGPELQVSMGPRPHLSFKTPTFGPAYKSLWVPDITCPFVLAKQRDEHLNYLSLCVPALICGFYMHNSDFWTRNTSFYGYQTSPVVLYMQIIVISTRITSLYGFQPSSAVLRIQNSDPFERGEHFWMQKSGFWTWIRSLYGFQTWSVVLCMQNSVISTRITSLKG